MSVLRAAVLLVILSLVPIRGLAESCEAALDACVAYSDEQEVAITKLRAQTKELVQKVTEPVLPWWQAAILGVAVGAVGSVVLLKR